MNADYRHHAPIEVEVLSELSSLQKSEVGLKGGPGYRWERNPVCMIRPRNVISCLTDKSIAGTPGQFQLVFTDQSLPDYGMNTVADLVRPMSVVRIRFDDHQHWSFMGLVDRVVRTRGFAGNTPSRQIQVSGRDLTKILVNHQIYYNEYETGGIARNFRFFFEGENLTGDPVKMVKTVIKIFREQDKKLNLRLVGNRPLHFYLDTESELQRDERRADDDFVTYHKSLPEYRGSVWALMESFANRPWNEMFIDTFPTREKNGSDTQSHLVLRPTPFDEKLWDGLSAREAGFIPADRLHGGAHRIEPPEIMQLSLGRSDQEVINWYFVYPTLYWGLDEREFKSMITHYIDEDSIHRYGLKVTNFTTKYGMEKLLGGDGKLGRNSDFVEMARRESERFHEWYKRNPEYESGTLLVKGRSWYHVGDPVYLTENGYRYYCEGVRQMYTFGGIRSTQIRLTRGWPE